ncbi:putative short-chain dehydrogenase/reductase SDR, NAD(P)-binding domain superfamily [Septoria linicola]|nr:putative short-chain dehydrogenase/reductase SDR, NAD(P)-binding domain superfamily [Septoria linicola]
MSHMTKRSVLITGCSDGGLGAHLAIAFDKAGWRVFATARNPAKITTVRAAGLETLVLDTRSVDSIATCASQVHGLTGGSLDMLLNNAGGGYSMPLLDVDLVKLREVFELNVFSLVTVSRGFLPLLRASRHGATIVNNTSCSSLPSAALPFAGSYNASKAAAANLTEFMRLELQPFEVKVVNLMTGAVRSSFHANLTETTLPPDSIYNVAKDRVERTMAGEGQSRDDGADPEVYAKHVVAKLSRQSPSHWVWEGKWTTLAWFGQFLPIGTLDRVIKNMVGLDILEKTIRQQNIASTKKVV